MSKSYNPLQTNLKEGCDFIDIIVMLVEWPVVVLADYTLQRKKKTNRLS